MYVVGTPATGGAEATATPATNVPNRTVLLDVSVLPTLVTEPVGPTSGSSDTSSVLAVAGLVPRPVTLSESPAAKGVASVRLRCHPH